MAAAPLAVGPTTRVVLGGAVPLNASADGDAGPDAGASGRSARDRPLHL